MKIVIRAGGSGTRLWPLSRQAEPKQFQALLSDRSLLRQTFERVKPALSDPEDMYVSVNRAHVERLRQELPEIVSSNIIAEPDNRNTGPAMCLEICFLEQRLPSETIIATLPSDDHITNEQAFCSMLQACEEFISAHGEYIVTPAVTPEYPESGYSYLRAGERLGGTENVVLYKAEDIIEKPGKETCEELIKQGNYFWHTGMYVWKLGRIAELFEELQPELIKACRQISKDIITPGKEAMAAEAYSRLEKTSVESAITTKVSTLALSVAPGLGWSDVGKWRSIKRILAQDIRANMLDNNAIAHNSEGNLVISREKKLIVLNHVKNLAIIETPDALLISDMDAGEDIKKIIEQLSGEHPHLI